MLYFILGIIAGGVIIYFVLKSKKKKKAAKKGDETKDSNPVVEARKENLSKLENYIKEKSAKDKITNDEVQELLKVSDATAERYLAEFEKRGILKQFGQIGHDVYYLKAIGLKIKGLF